MIKVAGYIIVLLGLVVVPILDKAAIALEEAAKKTPESYDDILAGAFRTVVDALKSGEIFGLKKQDLPFSMDRSHFLGTL